MLKALSILACLLLGVTTLQAREPSPAEKLSDQVSSCLSIPDEATKQNVRIKVEFTLDAKGDIASPPFPLAALKTPAAKAYMEAAKRAIIRCAPYPFAANETVRINFVP